MAGPVGQQLREGAFVHQRIVGPSQLCNYELHTSYHLRVTSRPPEPDRRRTAAAARRREREKEIIAATRALFDAQGVRDAQIEDIAKAVGINRAIVYRHFSGKEELFALTLVGYLDELQGRAVGWRADDPRARLACWWAPSSTTASPTRRSSTAPRR